MPGISRTRLPGLKCFVHIWGYKCRTNVCAGLHEESLRGQVLNGQSSLLQDTIYMGSRGAGEAQGWSLNTRIPHAAQKISCCSSRAAGKHRYSPASQLCPAWWGEGFGGSGCHPATQKAFFSLVKHRTTKLPGAQMCAVARG